LASSLWHVFATARPLVCASQLTPVARSMFSPGIILHSRHTTRLIEL
jgi:hypothetical protein